MYILYCKQLYIVKEPLTKNRVHQTWRGKQLAMCENRAPLQACIDKQPPHERERYYIEQQPERYHDAPPAGQ